MSYFEQSITTAPSGAISVHAVHQSDVLSEEKGSPIVDTGQESESLQFCQATPTSLLFLINRKMKRFYLFTNFRSKSL